MRVDTTTPKTRPEGALTSCRLVSDTMIMEYGCPHFCCCSNSEVIPNCPAIGQPKPSFYF